jgi:peptidyl-prolyl cis-trans isomerase C
MNIEMNFLARAGGGVLSLCLVGAALAAEAPMAVVNGVPIAARLLDINIEANVAQGQKDTPEMRTALKQELIARELMVQEAQKRGLEQLPTTQDALLTLRQNLLIELVLNDEFKKNPVTQTELKDEYDRQVKVLKAAGDLSQYQISIIVLDSEADARAVLAALRAGQAFDALAKSRSIDPSKDQGGALGWVLPDQIAPPISNVVVNLTPGAVSAAPIQMGRMWHLVKLDAKRPFQVPGFEESKNLLQNAVVQTRRSALLKKMLDAAVLK